MDRARRTLSFGAAGWAAWLAAVLVLVCAQVRRAAAADVCNAACDADCATCCRTWTLRATCADGSVLETGSFSTMRDAAAASPAAQPAGGTCPGSVPPRWLPYCAPENAVASPLDGPGGAALVALSATLASRTREVERAQATLSDFVEKHVVTRAGAQRIAEAAAALRQSRQPLAEAMGRASALRARGEPSSDDVSALEAATVPARQAAQEAIARAAAVTSDAGVIDAAADARAAKPAQGSAQPAAREADVAGRLFAEGLFERALQHYQTAYDLAHKPSDLQKVGDCQRALGDVGAAHDTYAKLLAVHRPALGFRAVALEKTVAELEAATGVVAIRSTPEGAVVSVGGRVVGVTPLQAPVRAPVGVTHVEVQEDGFEPFAANVPIDATHPASVSAMLARRVVTAHLSVRDDHGATAHLVLDDEDVGPLPWQGDVPAGTHTLVLRSETVEAAPQTLKLRAGSSAEAVFTSTSTAGHAHVTVTPPSAAIAIDGKELATGVFDGDVPSGSHVLRVSAAGFETVEQPLTVLPRGTASLDVALHKAVSPEDVARQKQEEDAAKLRGGYGRVDLFGSFSLSSSHLQCAEVSGGDTVTCGLGVPVGGGLAVHGGYSFGLLGVEGVLVLTTEAWQDTASYPGTGTSSPQIAADVAHSESYTWVRPAGLVGAGPRVTTPLGMFRFTAGAAGGVAATMILVTRTLSNGLNEAPPYADTLVTISPAVMADVGVSIGSTPGAAFAVGLMAWAEFPSTAALPEKDTTQFTSAGTTLPNGHVGPLTVERGAQVFFGPYVGVRFGH